MNQRKNVWPRNVEEAREALRSATEIHGLQLKECEHGHFQIMGGGVLVNYWPASKKKSAYVAGERCSVGPMGVQDVIDLMLRKQMELQKRREEEARNRSKVRRTNQRQVRLALLAEDPHCYYCRVRLTMDTATVEHLVPLSRGGTNHRSNKVLACKGCNHARADVTVEDVQ